MEARSLFLRIGLESSSPTHSRAGEAAHQQGWVRRISCGLENGRDGGESLGEIGFLIEIFLKKSGGSVCRNNYLVGFACCLLPSKSLPVLPLKSLPLEGDWIEPLIESGAGCGGRKEAEEEKNLTQRWIMCGKRGLEDTEVLPALNAWKEASPVPVTNVFDIGFCFCIEFFFSCGCWMWPHVQRRQVWPKALHV